MHIIELYLETPQTLYIKTAFALQGVRALPPAFDMVLW